MFSGITKPMIRLHTANPSSGGFEAKVLEPETGGRFSGSGKARAFTSPRPKTNAYFKSVPSEVKFRIGMMKRKFTAVVALSVLTLANLGARELEMVIDNLKYSRDFYSNIHFVAIAKLPQPFKYDRYPSDGPERIQCDDGTYLRQHGKAWAHLGDRMRTGLPIDYAESSRYVMTFAAKDSWGRAGEPVDKETARKLDGWIKLVDAALNAAPAAVKLADKSEAEGRAQWVFEAASENPNGVPTRLRLENR